MGLSAFYLGNFKAIGRTQRIPIKPITLVFGPNSSGKSSLIQGLMAIFTAFKEHDLDLYRINMRQESIDLGGFNNYIYQQDRSNRLELGLEYTAGEELPLLDEGDAGSRARFHDLLVALAPEGELGRCTFRVVLGESPFFDPEAAGSWSERFISYSYYFEIEHFVRIKVVLAKAHSEDSDEIYYVYHASEFELLSPWASEIEAALALGAPLDYPFKHKQSRLFLQSVPEGWLHGAVLKDVDGFKNRYGNYLYWPFAHRSNDPLGVGGAFARLQAAPEFAFLLYWFTGLLMPNQGLPQSMIPSGQSDDEPASTLYGLNPYYLGPLRSVPGRHDSFTMWETNSEGSEGRDFVDAENPWEAVATSNYEWLDEVNKWLGDKRLKTPYEIFFQEQLALLDILSVTERVIRETLAKKLPAAMTELGDSKVLELLKTLQSDTSPDEVEQRLAAIGLSKQAIRIMTDEAFPPGRRQGRICLRDLRTGAVVGIEDVGAGISQVVPVLVYAVAIETGLCAISQPELHLHPRLQCELMDFLISEARDFRLTFHVIEPGVIEEFFADFEGDSDFQLTEEMIAEKKKWLEDKTRL